MPDLAKYVVSLEAETSRYRRELDRANKKLGQFHRDTTSRLDRMAASMRSFSRAFAIGFGALAGTGLVTAARNTLRVADNLDKLAVRLGVSSRELQAWGIIAERFNVSQNQANLAIQRFTRRTAEAAQGTGEAKGALKELGIDARTFANLPLDERMLRLAGALQGVNSESDRLRIAFKLFDSEGTSVLQFLSQGEEGLRNLRDELEGQLWSEEEVKRLSDLNTELTKLSQTLQLQFGPVLASIGKTFSDYLKKAQDEVLRLTRAFQTLQGNQFAAAKLNEQNGFTSPPDIIVDRGASQGRPVPGINPSVTFSPREIAPASGIQDPSSVMSTRTDAMVEEFSDMLTQMERRQENFVTLFTDNMVEAASGGFDSILKSWSRTLQQMAARALTSQLFKLLGFGNADGGFLGLGKLFGGARADGGPVSAGKSYLVGERGPELFTPGASGFITPNGGGGNVINIDARGAVPGVETRIRAAVEEAVARADRNRIEAGRRG